MIVKLEKRVEYGGSETIKLMIDGTRIVSFDNNGHLYVAGNFVKYDRNPRLNEIVNWKDVLHDVRAGLMADDQDGF